MEEYCTECNELESELLEHPFDQNRMVCFDCRLEIIKGAHDDFRKWLHRNCYVNKEIRLPNGGIAK